MKLFLIGYVILINLISFFLMGIDKRKARRHTYRISERTLFLTALVGGSVGILIGMYLFRHKTRHLSFTFGIPLLLTLQLLLITALFSWNQKHMGSPSQAVEYELRLIQELDADTIQSFISYENLTNSRITDQEAGAEASEAVQLFFQDFQYHIHSETIEDNNATVSANITNIDAKALAEDLRASILLESLSAWPQTADAPSMNDYYRLLGDTLKNNSYEAVVTTAYFHLRQDDSGWTILVDSELEDELTGGFISSMNDPKLLSPETVLSAYLDAFGRFDKDEWMEFLNIEDVFATCNEEYYRQIDEEYFRQIADSFSYEILRSQTEGDTAYIDVRVTSIDLESVFAVYKESLLDYAATTQSIRDDSVAASSTMAELLLEALRQNEKTGSTDIVMELINNGETWNVTFDDAFTNALMGDTEQALETFHSQTS